MSEDSEKGVQGPLQEVQQQLGKESWVEVQRLRAWAEGSDRKLEITSGRDGPFQACRVWGFLTVWPELGGSNESVGPPFLGEGTSESEKLQAQGKDRRESGHAGPESGGFGPQREQGLFLPGVRCSPALACSLPGPKEMTWWRSLGLSGSEAAFSVPGLLGAESGAVHSSPRVAAQGSGG